MTVGSELHGAGVDDLVAEPLLEGVDVDLGSGDPPVPFEERQQAAHRRRDVRVSGPGRPSADRRLLTELWGGKPSGEERAEQSKTHVGGHSPLVGRSGHPPHDLFVNGKRWERAGTDSQVGTLEHGDDAAGAQVALDAAQEVRRVAEVHQDPTTDHGVEVAGEIGVVKVAGDELDVRRSHGSSALARRLEDRRVGVHTDDPAFRSDEICGEEGDVAGAAAEVEDLHATGDAGGAEQPPGERPVDLRLEDEAACLGVRPTERIGVERCARHLQRIGRSDLQAART